MVQKKQRFEMKLQLYCHALQFIYIYSILHGPTIEFEYQVWKCGWTHH